MHYNEWASLLNLQQSQWGASGGYPTTYTPSGYTFFGNMYPPDSSSAMPLKKPKEGEGFGFKKLSNHQFHELLDEFNSLVE